MLMKWGWIVGEWVMGHSQLRVLAHPYTHKETVLIKGPC